MAKVPPKEFMDVHRSMEVAYTAFDDPIRQSGFHGGPARWEAERSPIIQAIDSDGDFLDIGCANGLLVENVVEWAAVRGCAITPYGIDLGLGLIEIAKQRMPDHAQNFVAGDAWNWEPGRQWEYVYSLADVSPHAMRSEWLARMYSLVRPAGRMILGSYRSSTGEAAIDPSRWLEDCGYDVEGSLVAGKAEASRFAWTYKPNRP